MEFRRKIPGVGRLPAELVGKWTIGTRQYDFRANGDYLILDHGVPYSLVESGAVLVHSGTRYTRLYGGVTEVTGVWLLEDDPTDEWNIRSDGTYTYHGIGFETFGEYTNNATTMSTSEFYAVLSESGGNLTYNPPYAPSESGPWSLVEHILTVNLPSGQVQYTRVL
jgi:hypothetical protein